MPATDIGYQYINLKSRWSQDEVEKEPIRMLLEDFTRKWKIIRIVETVRLKIEESNKRCTRISAILGAGSLSLSLSGVLLKVFKTFEPKDRVLERMHSPRWHHPERSENVSKKMIRMKSAQKSQNVPRLQSTNWIRRTE